MIPHARLHRLARAALIRSMARLSLTRPASSGSRASTMPSAIRLSSSAISQRSALPVTFPAMAPISSEDFVRTYDATVHEGLDVEQPVRCVFEPRVVARRRSETTSIHESRRRRRVAGTKTQRHIPTHDSVVAIHPGAKTAEHTVGRRLEHFGMVCTAYRLRATTASTAPALTVDRAASRRRRRAEPETRPGRPATPIEVARVRRGCAGSTRRTTRPGCTAA